MKLLFAIFSMLSLLLVFTSGVFAANIERSEVVTLPQNEVINEDYFATGEKVVLSGTVNGDAYLAGGNIIVDGNINGDLLAVGGTITILGKISEDVRTAGGQIIISGEIGKNLTTAGGSVEITSSAKINGSLVAGAGNVSIFAPLAKGATLGAGSVTLGNQVGGNVNAGVGQITLTQGARINGDLTYLSNQNAQIQRGAQVAGKTTHNFPPEPKRDEPAKAIGGAILALKIISFLSALLVGFIILRLFPGLTKRTASTVVTKPFSSLGLGFITLIIIPIVCLILLVTLIGIPIAAILFFAFLVKIYIAKIFISVAIGQKVLKATSQKPQDFLALFVGLVIYYLITLVPLVGWLIAFVAILIGLGAILTEEKFFYHQLKGKI